MEHQNTADHIHNVWTQVRCAMEHRLRQISPEEISGGDSTALLLNRAWKEATAMCGLRRVG